MFVFAVFQVILLEESWSELFLLNAVQWCLPLEHAPLFSPQEHSALNGKGSGSSPPAGTAADVRVLNDTLLRFKTHAVDPAEFACLKAIVLFRSGESAGTHCKKIKGVLLRLCPGNTYFSC